MQQRGVLTLTSSKHKKRNRSAWRTLMRGALSGTAVLILSTLILTFLVYLEWLPESSIPIGNTVIKILTALAAGIAVGCGKERAPWLFGGIAADLALLLSVAIMSVYLGAFRLSWSLLADLLLCFAIGCAASAVFLKRKTE